MAARGSNYRVQWQERGHRLRERPALHYTLYMRPNEARLTHAPLSLHYKAHALYSVGPIYSTCCPCPSYKAAGQKVRRSGV